MKTFTTQQVAELLGVEPWRVRRLYEDRSLPEPQRFGGARVISSADVPAVIDALRERGWLERYKLVDRKPRSRGYCVCGYSRPKRFRAAVGARPVAKRRRIGRRRARYGRHSQRPHRRRCGTRSESQVDVIESGLYEAPVVPLAGGRGCAARLALYRCIRHGGLR